MFIVNNQKLSIVQADDETYPLYEQAREVRNGISFLKNLYKDGKITFTRKGYPKIVDGIDPQGRDIKIPEEAPPLQFPLNTEFKHPKRGTEVWGCCLGTPHFDVSAGWDIGKRRNFTVNENVRVDINKDPDFAYYLYYICNAVKGGHLKVEDPKADAKAKGDKKREALERETAIWQTLADEAQLHKIAQAYGVSDVTKKEPDTIRFELESILKDNDEMKKRDPSYKGTKEFLEELKITDYVRLSAFIRHWLDEGMITYKPDGRYYVGDKVIAHVPTDYITKKFPWLCNYFAAPNNGDKIRELMKDLVNKEYLDTINDPKDFRWLAKVMNIEGYYNQTPDKVKDLVFAEFIV